MARLGLKAYYTAALSGPESLDTTRKDDRLITDSPGRFLKKELPSCRYIDKTSCSMALGTIARSQEICRVAGTTTKSAERRLRADRRTRLRS